MIDGAIFQKLASLVSSERISRRPEDLIAASYDASKQKALPDLVIKPLTAREISGILKIAYERNIPIVPHGAASGTTGGVVPVKGGIVIDTILMNKILEVNADDMTAVVEPGVVVADFQKAVKAKGLFYPPDPASAEFCTMGGNVAECAGGLRCVKYGVTRDYILGLEVVLPDGTIIHTGTKTLKSVTGYDLTRLFVGSEGTLGIFTRIIVRLIPKPEAVTTINSFFGSMTKALAASSGVFKQHILPSALEIVDEPCLQAIKQYSEGFRIPDKAQAMLLIELDGDASVVTKQAQKVSDYLKNQGAFGIARAETPAEQELLWSLRKAISPALYRLAPKKVNEDVCLPRSRLSAMFAGIKELETKYHIPTATFGHAGDGNLHVHFLVSSQEHEQKLPAAVKELFQLTTKLSGTISGEHGIGITKSPYLSLEIMPEELRLMKSIKELIDPKGTMNPGKIF